MTYSPESAAVPQIPDACPACGTVVCPCTPQQRLEAVIAAEFDEAFAKTREWVDAQPKPRDSMPLAGYRKGWDR